MDTAPYVEVCVTQRFSASPERVFDAWLDPAMASAWLFATASHPISRVEIDARVGGSFRFADRRDGGKIEHRGKYLELVRPRRLMFTLSMENSPKVVTRVIAEIVPLKTGCELTLTHKNVPPDYASRAENRWTGILYGLGVTLNSLSGRGDSSMRKNSGRSRSQLS
jgi:uncharacterized protein YndB with AHSA1/START domain